MITIEKATQVSESSNLSEALFQQIVEFSPDAIYIQIENRVVYINANGRKLFNVDKPENYIGKLVWGLMLPANWEIVAKRYSQSMKGETETILIELKFIHPDGSLVDMEVTAIPTTFQKKPTIQAIFRDVTEQKRAEDENRQRNKELSILYNITSTTSQNFDLTQALNDSLDEVLRLDLFAGKAAGMVFLVEEGKLNLAVHRGTPDGHPCLARTPVLGECLCGLAAQHGEIIVSNDCYQNVNHSHHRKEMPSHRDICLPLKARGNVLGVMSLRLPPEQMILESDLKLLTSIADQIAVAVENARLFEARLRAIMDERERIAGELHDGLAQILGFVSNKATTVRLHLRNHDLKNAETHLLKLEEAAQQVFVDIREAIIGLKIAGQVDKGLTTALADFSNQFSRLNDIPVEVKIADQIESLSISTETKIHILRIVQEAMSNARKHACPNRLWINSKVVDDMMELEVRDDGAGFRSQLNTLDNMPHYGMTTMRERAKTIGAELIVKSAPGKGTTVSVRLPIEDKQYHAYLGRR